MKVTPLDLKKADFKRVMRGFDPDDVNDMMAAAAETLEEMVRDNRELKEKVSSLDDRLKSYQSMEHTLNETLITAQKAGDSTRQAAERESELIVAKAEVQAEKLVEEAKSELKRIRYQIEMLEHEKEAFLVKMRSLVASQWKLLQEDFEPRRNATVDGRSYMAQEQAGPKSDPSPRIADESDEVVEELPPEPAEPEAAVEEEPQDFGDLSDKLGKILGSREQEDAQADDIGVADLEDGDDLDMGEEDQATVDPEDLTQQSGEDSDKPDVFWGDEQPDEAEEEEKGK